MLDAECQHGTCVQQERSAPILERDIAQRLHVINTAPHRIRETLSVLAADTSELISSINGNHGGGTYCVNMKRIVDLIKIKEVEAVVRGRFGGPACRIFRLLLLKRNLEQKQIAEMAMIPIKDTRELLYKLLKAEYVQMQEVARTVDHAPSRTFYLWHVDIVRVVEQVGQELFRAASNLRCRLMYEMSKRSETFSILELIQVDRFKGNSPKIAFTSCQRHNLHHIRHIAAALELSLMQIDELIMIFHVM